MNIPRRLFHNFVFLFAGNVLGQLFYLAGLVYLARVFSPAVFGLWNLAQAWMLYLFRGSEMGLELVGIRSFAPMDPVQRRVTVWGVLGIRVTFGIILVAITGLICLTDIFPGQGRVLVLVLALAVFPAAVTLEWIFEANQSVGIVSVARILKGAVFGLLVLLIVRSEDQLVEAGWLYICSLICAALVTILPAFWKFGLLPPSMSLGRAKELIRDSIPIGIAQLLSQYTLFLGTVLAGYMVSGERLGYYSAGHRLVIFLWAYGIVTSNRVILPQLSRLFESAHETFVEFVLKYLRILGILSLLVGVVGVAGGADIIGLLYGAKYSESISVFQILSLALCVAIIRSVLEVALIASHRQALYFKGMAGVAVLYTISTIVGLAFWDIRGAAWAAVLSEIGYAVYLALVFRLIPGGAILRVLTKPVLAFGVTLLLVILLNGITGFVLALIGIGTYLGLLIAGGELTKREIDIVAKLFDLEKRVA